MFYKCSLAVPINIVLLLQSANTNSATESVVDSLPTNKLPELIVEVSIKIFIRMMHSLCDASGAEFQTKLKIWRAGLSPAVVVTIVL